MQVGIDSYSYHRRYGEVRIGEVDGLGLVGFPVLVGFGLRDLDDVPVERAGVEGGADGRSLRRRRAVECVVAALGERCRREGERQHHGCRKPTEHLTELSSRRAAAAIHAHARPPSPDPGRPRRAAATPRTDP